MSGGDIMYIIIGPERKSMIRIKIDKSQRIQSGISFLKVG